jgi:plastocyanin
MSRSYGVFALVLIALVLVPGFAQAHSASTFNVIIKQNDLQPMSTQIEYNDSIMWYNADSRENVTQRIVFDADGDGLYNGSEDWDSGEISQDCVSSSNNSSSDCQESFMVWFNGTWGVGEYNYQSISSNGDVQNGTIVVIEHIEEDTEPVVNNDFDSFYEDDTDSSDDDSIKQIFLVVGIISALGSLVLILLLIKR